MSEILDIAGLPSLEDVGFTAGRYGFRGFCETVFASPEPRFLRNERDELVVFRHADLRAFGAAPEVGNVPIGTLCPGRYQDAGKPGEKPPGWEIGEVIGKQIFTYNPPLHGPARRILTSWMSPKRVGLMEELARKIAKNIIETLATGRDIDFVSAVADRMTIEFWSALLDLTRDETLVMARYIPDMTRLLHVHRSPEDTRILDLAFARYSKVIHDAAQRALDNGDPVMIEVAEKLRALSFEDDPAEGGVVPESLGAFLAGNLFDGFHTASLATANTFYALLRRPEALAAIRRTPDRLPRAISEALRLEPPVLFLPRYILADFHYDGIIIPSGNVITMLWAAGNHDPSVFTDPEMFDLDRTHVGLTTFGGGIHICPGRYIAVMLVRVLIEEMEFHGVDVESETSPATWYPDHKMSQLKAMPVRLSRRVG